MIKSTRLRSLNVLLIAVCTVTLAHGDLSAQNTREYRPLMAKKVKVVVAASAEVKGMNHSVELTRQGWALFDDRNWKAAADKFLSALEVSPKDASAAEGLTMSLYRSGDYASAVSLSARLEPLMPQLKEMVAQTALADVRFMVNKSEMEAAREFMAHFPADDVSYHEAHATLINASAIETALGPDGSGGSSGSSLAGR